MWVGVSDVLSPSQGKDLLTQKIPVWQQACSDPNKLPERAMLLAQQMGSAAIAGTSPLHGSKSNLVISDPIPGATPLPVPPELAVFMGSGLGHPSVRRSFSSQTDRLGHAACFLVRFRG